VVVYHSGDTILYPDLVKILMGNGWLINVACLPVNGRDEKREQMGIIGNLNIHEAIQLALDVKAGLLIPIHNDLFTINQEDPEEIHSVLSIEKRIKSKTMGPGESFYL
jgi:L-ascorbate 6-phosphate lactonase